MKQIIAIIRNERFEDTKTALEKTGFLSFTSLSVCGNSNRAERRERARQSKGVLNWNFRPITSNGENISEPVAPGKDEISKVPDPSENEGKFRFLAKRMLVIVAHNDRVRSIVQAIANANQTDPPGDGRIFICPMINAIGIGEIDRQTTS